MNSNAYNVNLANLGNLGGGGLCNMPDFSSSKEQIFAKMQELDAALQSAVTARTELWSLLSNLSPEDSLAGNIEIPLTFYENGNIIAWGDDSEHFRPSTFRLLQEFWLTSDRVLSKEDVRLNVIEDDWASDLAIRHVIHKARGELERVDFPYEIVTLRKEQGYKMKAKNKC